MKNISLAVLLAVSTMSSVALASSHTVSLGYAQSDVQNFNDISGANLQYRYEFDSPLSILGSFTYMLGDGKNSYYVANDAVTNNADVKYYSFLVGPAWRINEYVSLYALGGFAYVKASGMTKWEDSASDYIGREDLSEKSTSFAYGAGVLINLQENIPVNIGYEGTQADMDGNYSINCFNVGIGYRF